MNTTSTTSPIAKASVISTSCTDARIVVVRSIPTASFIPDGNSDASSSGISAVIASTVEIMFAPGWRKMISSTDGFPLNTPPV